MFQLCSLFLTLAAISLPVAGGNLRGAISEVENLAEDCFDQENYGCSADRYRVLMEHAESDLELYNKYTKSMVESALYYALQGQASAEDYMVYYLRVMRGATAMRGLAPDGSLLEAVLLYHAQEVLPDRDACKELLLDDARLKYLLNNDQRWHERSNSEGEFFIPDEYQGYFTDYLNGVGVCGS